MLSESNIQPGQLIVELGPGTGVFTNDILETLPANCQYIGIEINETFANHLQETYPDTTIHHGSAENICRYVNEAGRDQCQRIISGLPWSAFRPHKQEDLLANIYEALAEDGLFLTFSYPPFHHLPRGRAFRDKLKSTFSAVRKTDTVFNIPPAFVYVCKK